MIRDRDRPAAIARGARNFAEANFSDAAYVRMVGAVHDGMFARLSGPKRAA